VALLDKSGIFNLLLALWVSNKYPAGPKGSDKDLLLPEPAHHVL